MLKKISWIAALFFALAILFTGCTEAGLLDDGSAPANPEPLVVDGEDLEFTAVGSGASQVSFDGNVIKFTGAGTSAGFSFKIPAAADDYAKFKVNFKVVKIEEKKPGLLIKRNNEFKSPAGITSDDDPEYQLNDADSPAKGGFDAFPGLHFEEGMEFDTGEWEISRFDGVVAFQHQAWNPGDNAGASYTLELLNVVFPGKADAKVIFDVDGGEAVKTIVVEQGKEIGDLPSTTKDGAVFAGWYIDATEITSDWEVPFFGKDDVKAITLKAKWVTSGVTTTATSIIAVSPKFDSATSSNITIDANGAATFVVNEGWPSVKYVFPTEVLTANGAGTLLDPYTYKYNVVELTLSASETFVLQVQKADASGNIQRYPEGSEVITVEKDKNFTFSVALSDSGYGGLALQNKINEAGNKAGTVVKIVSAVFTEGTTYKVSFDRTVPIRNTDVPTQTILSGRMARDPGPQSLLGNSIVIDFLGWYLDGELFEFEETAITEDIDILSMFGKATKRTITYVPNGGTFTGNMKEVVTFTTTNPTGDDLAAIPTKTADPTGAGAFAGWWDVTVTPIKQYVDASGDGVATAIIDRDITLTARWAPAAAKVFTTFTQSGGYGATATANAGEWSINAGYQRLRLDLGEVLQSYDYPTITIEYEVDAATFRVHTFDSAGENTTGSPFYPTITTGGASVTVNNTGATKYIGFDNSGGAAITLKITKITFNLN